MKKLMTLLTAAAVALCLVACCGCGGSSLDHGRIIDKQYQEPLTTTMLFPMPISCGTSCTTFIMIPWVVYDDADWILWLEACEKDPETGERSCDHGEAYVDQQTYEEWEVGEWFNSKKLPQGATASSSDPVSKEHEA